MERSRLLGTDAAELPLRQATGSLIMTLGRKTMKRPSPTIVSAVSYSLAHKILFIAVLGGAFAVGGPFIYFGSKYSVPLLREIGGLIILIGFLASIFTTREIIFRMQEEGTLLYGKATAHTLYGYLRYVYFMPILGPFAQKLMERKRAENPFVQQNEK
jgi:hypothetical protein